MKPNFRRICQNKVFGTRIDDLLKRSRYVRVEYSVRIIKEEPVVASPVLAVLEDNLQTILI